MIKFCKQKSKKELLKNISNNNLIKDDNRVDCILENMNQIIVNKSTKISYNNQTGKYKSVNQNSQASLKSTNN